MTKKTQTPTTSPSEEVKETKIPMLKVIAKFTHFNPDLRAYKPSTPNVIFDPPLMVVIDIPEEEWKAIWDKAIAEYKGEITCVDCHI